MRWLRTAAAISWPLLQITAAATVAWVIARTLGDHPDPFFAPIAAVVALSSPLGERGRSAIRLLLGVLIGIGCGELTLVILGGGYGRLAVATFTATLAARAISDKRLVIVQAAGAAILTVASAGGEAGLDRLVDALIGAGVALVGSQFLFSPEPVTLVRRAEVTALHTMARALGLTAEALETHDVEPSERSLAELRTLRDDLAELARLRTAGHRVAQHSAVWRHRRTPVVEEAENAGHLDLLGVSCLTLARTSMAVGVDHRARLVPHIRELARLLQAVGDDPGDRATRQAAADDALRLATAARSELMDGPSSVVAAGMSLRLAVIDLLVFAGLEVQDARRALEDDEDSAPDVRTLPATPKLRLPLGRRRPPRE
jgi:uncharacterized membrane protein YgaE (UPF0421/DUF939 family)